MAGRPRGAYNVKLVTTPSLLVKPLPQVCRKIQHEGARRETNTARGEAECLFVSRHPRVLYFLYTLA